MNWFCLFTYTSMAGVHYEEEVRQTKVKVYILLVGRRQWWTLYQRPPVAAGRVVAPHTLHWSQTITPGTCAPLNLVNTFIDALQTQHTKQSITRWLLEKIHFLHYSLDGFLIDGGKRWVEELKNKILDFERCSVSLNLWLCRHFKTEHFLVQILWNTWVAKERIHHI